VHEAGILVGLSSRHSLEIFQLSDFDFGTFESVAVGEAEVVVRKIERLTNRISIVTNFAIKNKQEINGLLVIFISKHASSFAAYVTYTWVTHPPPFSPSFFS